MADVVVVGGGLAGVLAALEARRQGAKVALARRSYGATAMASGALDIAFSPALSPVSQVSRTVAEHIMDIVAHRPRHPYGTLGLEASVQGVRDGFALLTAALEGTGLAPAPLDLEAENRGLPSSLGTILPAASALGSHVGIDLHHEPRGRWGVVGLLGDRNFDADRVTSGLRADLDDLGAARIELQALRVDFGEGASSLDLARRLDDQAEVDALAAKIAAVATGLDGVIVSPVLGLRSHATTHARLAEKLGLGVVEALGHVPSVPGLRLQLALDASLKAADVTVLPEVTGARFDADNIAAVRTVDGAETSAGAVVLASGRFIAGGVIWDDDGCRESLFGLPVVTEAGPLEVDSPLAVVRETPMDSHPLMTAGVLVDEKLRPQREGRTAHANLFAAGMLLGGFASRYVLCADGVAMASGVHAARQATRRAGGAD